MNYNHVTLVGRLTQDPVLTVAKISEINVAEFSLQVNRPYKDAEGNTRSDYLPVVAFGKLAEVCSEFLSKGRLVLIEGTIETIRTEQINADPIYKTRIAAGSVKFLEPLRTGNATN